MYPPELETVPQVPSPRSTSVARLVNGFSRTITGVLLYSVLVPLVNTPTKLPTEAELVLLITPTEGRVSINFPEANVPVLDTCHTLFIDAAIAITNNSSVLKVSESYSRGKLYAVFSITKEYSNSPAVSKLVKLISNFADVPGEVTRLS